MVHVLMLWFSAQGWRRGRCGPKDGVAWDLLHLAYMDSGLTMLPVTMSASAPPPILRGSRYATECPREQPGGRQSGQRGQWERTESVDEGLINV